MSQPLAVFHQYYYHLLFSTTGWSKSLKKSTFWITILTVYQSLADSNLCLSRCLSLCWRFDFAAMFGYGYYGEQLEIGSFSFARLILEHRTAWKTSWSHPRWWALEERWSIFPHAQLTTVWRNLSQIPHHLADWHQWLRQVQSLQMRQMCCFCILILASDSSSCCCYCCIICIILLYQAKTN